MGWYKQTFVQRTLIGMLLGVGFVFPVVWPAGLIGVAGVLWLLQQSWCRWQYMWWVWFVKSAVATSWVWAVYPLDWIGFDLGLVELPIIGFYWLTVSASLAVGGIGLFFLHRLLMQRIPNGWGLALFPLVWLLAELLGSLGFAVFLYGPGGSIGATFSMGYIGYLLAEHDWLIWVSTVAGVYGLTLLFVALGVGLYVCLVKGCRWWAFGLGLLLMVTNVWSPVYTTDAHDAELTIAVVDTQFESIEEGIRLPTQAALEAALSTKADYVLFPEDSRLFDQSLTPAQLATVLQFQFAGTDTKIIDSGRVETGDQAVLQAMWFDGETGEVHQSQKRYLVPQGEYLPHVYSFLFQLVGQSATSDTLQERLSYRVGQQTSQAYFGPSIPAVLFCFEVVDPLGVWRSLRERTDKPPFVAHVLSHAWINHSPVFQHQLETMLRVQAIWNDTYIVSAANQSVGYTVTNTGAIVLPTPIVHGDRWQVGIVTVPQ